MSLKKSLKAILALGILTTLIYKVGFSDVIQQLSKITPSAIAFLLYISVVLVYISALKWKLFLEVFADTVSLGKLFSLYLVGYFINLVLPSYVGGDAVRSWQIGKKVGQHQALAATVLERYTGIAAMLSMAFLFMWFVESVTIEIEIAVFLMVAALLSLTLLVLSQFFMNLLRKLKLPAKYIAHFERIKEALIFAKSHPGLFLKALSLSYLFHILAVINVITTAYAVGWREVPFFDLFIVLPLVLTIGSLPVTPSGLGLQEGAYYFFLQGLGATPGEATAVALVLRAKSYVLALFGGVVWFFLKKDQKTEVRKVEHE